VAVAPEAFRDTLKLFASGITIVTATLDGVRFGMTCTSFASVSLEPPLVIVCLERDSHTLAAVSGANYFAVSILGTEQEDIARSFSRPGDKPFDEFPNHPAPNGASLIEGAIGWLACEVVSNVVSGDHNVVVGRVEDCASAEGPPILYFNRGYRRLS
jgi:flavin reductase (DIM6/NTAB) family NADH-FMN oxidoreductase RutF